MLFGEKCLFMDRWKSHEQHVLALCCFCEFLTYPDVTISLQTTKTIPSKWSKPLCNINSIIKVSSVINHIFLASSNWTITCLKFHKVSKMSNLFFYSIFWIAHHYNTIDIFYNTQPWYNSLKPVMPMKPNKFKTWKLLQNIYKTKTNFNVSLGQLKNTGDLVVIIVCVGVFVPHAYLKNIVSVVTGTNVTFTTEGTDSDCVFVENGQIVTVAAVNVPHPVETGRNPSREYWNEGRAKKGLTEKTNTRTATIRVERDRKWRSCKNAVFVEDWHAVWGLGSDREWDREKG